MGVAKDSYDIIKDLLSEAKKLRNLEFVEMVSDIQQRFFELNKENVDLKSINSDQARQIGELKNSLSNFDKIKNENEELKKKILIFDKSNDLSFLDQMITTKYIEHRTFYASSMPPPILTTLEETIGDIYYCVAPKLISPREDDKFSEIFRKSVNGTYSYLISDLVGKLKAKFLEFELIEIIDKANKPFIQLTDFGKKVLNTLNKL